MEMADLARVLGCTEEEAITICTDQHLSAALSDGSWTITKSELLRQLSELRSPATSN